MLGDLAKIGIKHLLIAVTDKRVLVLQLGSKKFRPIVKAVVASLPVNQLKEVCPEKGTLTSSLKLVTYEGRKFQYRDLLQSAADRLADNIRESLQKQIAGERLV